MTASPPARRQYFLDWLRIAAFSWLVVYHTGMYFVTWDWHVKSPILVPAFEPWMSLTQPWRMSLLFLLSGAATTWMLARGTGGVLRERSRRLLLPLLTGVALIVPPQAYLEAVERYGYSGGFASFLALYFSAHQGFCQGSHCLILPTWNHLWFLPYLWCYTVLLLALPARWRATAAAQLDRLPTWGLWLAPVLWLAALRMGLRSRFPPTHALVDDLYQHTVFGTLFLIGVALALRPAMFTRLQRLRWPALGAALFGWAALQLKLGPPIGWPLLYAMLQWSAIVAALGFAQRHLDRDHPWRAPLTEAVFPLYLLHQTLIIVVAVALRPLDAPAWAQALLIIAACLAGSALGWQLARRSGPLRPWLGLPATSAAGPSGPRDTR